MVVRVFLFLLSFLVVSFSAQNALAGRGEENFELGEKLYYEGKFNEASKALGSAISQLSDPEKKARAHITFGMLEMARGSNSKAETQFRKAIELTPNRKLSARKYPPGVIRLYGEAKARSLGSISIQTTPSDAKVYVDGKLVGLTPVFVKDLLVGQHVIKIEKEKYRTEEKKIVVRASERGVYPLDLIIADDIPAIIDHTPVNKVQEGKSLRIRASVSDNYGVADVTLFYQTEGASEYTSVPMEQVEKGLYEGVAPRTSIVAGGLGYYISATDIGGNVTTDGAPTNPHIARVIELDKEAPRIFHTPLISTSDASDLVIRAKVKDNKKLASVRVAYKGIEGDSFIEERMNYLPVKGEYVTPVPDELLRGKHIFYFIEATDESGNVQFSGRADSPHKITVYFVSPHKEGYVVERKVDEDGDLTRNITINVGALKGAQKGQRFTVFNAKEKIIDPETGMVLSINQKLRGKIKITIAGPNSSQAKVVEEHSQYPIEKGDLIRIKPGPPTGVGGYSAKFRENTVTWNMSPEPEIKGYIVYRSEEEDGPFTEFAKVRGKDKVETKDKGTRKNKLIDGKKYFYQVRSYNDEKEFSDLSQVGFVVAKGGPNPPKMVEASSGLIRKIPVKWRKSDDSETKGYKLFRSDKGAGKYTEIARINFRDDTEYVDKPNRRAGHKVEDGKTYWYKLVSYNEEGKFGNPTEPVYALTRQKPKSPSGFKVDSVAVRSISLSWNMSPDAEISKYLIYRNDSPTGKFKMIKEVRGRADTEYNDKDKSGTSLKDGKTYYYRISALNSGGAESDLSSHISGTTLGPPGSAGNITAQSGEVKQVTVSWITSSDPEINGYVVYRGVGKENMAPIKKIRNRDATSFTDAGSWNKRLEDGKTYYYTIRSYNSVDVESPPSSIVEAKTKSVPTAPRGLNTSQQQAKKVIVAWAANPEPDIVGYRVFRSSKSDSGFSLIASSVKGTQYVDSGLKDGATYYYKVQATDKDNLIGVESEAISTSTKAAPVAPVGVNAAAISGNSVALSWNANPEPDIDHYVIYSSGFFGTKLGSTKKTSYMVKKLTPGASYSFQIEAVGKDGLKSEKSAPVTVNTSR